MSTAISPWKENTPSFSGPRLEALVNEARAGLDVIVPQFLYRGKTTICYGDPSIGKTTLALNIAACLSCGHNVFDRLPCRPSRVLVVLFETDPEEAAESLHSIRQAVPINFENLCIDPYLIGINVSDYAHAQAAIARVALFKPDAILIDPLYMLTRGGLSKDEPAAVVMQFLRELSVGCRAALLGFHHGKKEQFDEDGKRLPNNYYGAVWIKAHARIMWRVEKAGADGSERLLTKDKDNLGVCLDEITLYYDDANRLCTMKQEGDATARTRLIHHLGLLPKNTATTTTELTQLLAVSKRTLVALLKDKDVLALVKLEREIGKPTVWRRV